MNTEQPTPEYDAINFDGLERRANYRTIAYREDMLHIFDHKDAAAIIYEIIYWWQANVRKKEVLKEIERRKKTQLPPLTEKEVEEMMWVWMSYNEFVRESGGALGYNTVIRMLDYLIATRLIEQRPNHDPRYPDFEYRINKEAAKKKLKALPAQPAFIPKVPKKKSKKSEDSTQMGTGESQSTQMGTSDNDLPKRVQHSTQMGTEVYPSGGTSHNYSHSPLITSSQGGTDGSAIATPAPARVSHPEHDFLWFDDLVKPTVMWVRYTQAFPGPMFSEYEDKRRSRRADEIRCFFEGRGINVKVIYEHETGDEKTIEPTPAPVTSQDVAASLDWLASRAPGNCAHVWDVTSPDDPIQRCSRCGTFKTSSQSHSPTEGHEHESNHSGSHYRDTADDSAHRERTERVTTSEQVARVYTNSYNEDGSVYSAGAPDADSEKDDEDTVKMRAVPPEFSTQRNSYPQSGKASAHKAPARPAQSGRKEKAARQQAYRVFWSLEAGQVRDWYQDIIGLPLDDTAPNAAACHHLSKKNGMDYDTLKAVQALIDADEWLGSHNQAVGVQELADDKGNWRWERWLQVVRRNQKKLAKGMAPTTSFDAEVEASRAAMKEIAAREKARANA